VANRTRSIAVGFAVVALATAFASSSYAQETRGESSGDSAPSASKSPPATSTGTQAPASKAPPHPEVIDTRPYAEAKAAAEKEDKWFLVKATAVWCMPCKQMDRTTMVDPKVVEWLKKNAIIVSVDVDKEPALAKSLEIAAMPTTIAFRKGEEFDRIVGMRAAAPFLAWLEGMAQGKKSIEAVRARAAARPDGTIDVDARCEEAQALVQARKYAEATAAYEWLWRHMLEHDPSMGGVRISFMATNMQELAARSPDAKTRFTALRDEAAKGLADEKVDARLLGDWIVLNKVIGDDKATLDWFDRVKGDRRWRELVRRQVYLRELLMENGRLGDYGALIEDPVEEIRDNHRVASFDHGMPEGIDAEQKAGMLESMHLYWREQCAVVYAAVLAAGREEEALAAAKEAMKFDSGAAMVKSLVAKALEADQARQVQIEWIDAALAASKATEGDAAPKPPEGAASMSSDDANSRALAALPRLRSKAAAALKSAESAAPKAPGAGSTGTPSSGTPPKSTP